MVAPTIETGRESTAVETVYASIKGDILAGRRHPGEKLRIERMRGIYGVGPTPLRETLQRLTAEGLVVAHSGRGFSGLPELSLGEFIDLNMARIEVELAALRAGDSGMVMSTGNRGLWRMPIACSGLTMRWRMVRRSRWRIGSRPTGNFTRRWFSACPSATLLQMRDDLNDKCARYRRAALSRSYASRDLGGEHKAIAEAVLGHDVEAGCALLRQHYDRTLDLLKESFASSG